MHPKFKKGDNVICLYNNTLYGKDIFELEIGKIYTVVYCDYDTVRLSNDDHIRELIGYSAQRFVSLKEYRKQKLEKICSK